MVSKTSGRSAAHAASKEKHANKEDSVIQDSLQLKKAEAFSLITEEDLAYEEELVRNPYNLKLWQRYLEHKKNDSFKSRIFVYERALREFPGSYKLWKEYLELRVSKVLHIPKKSDDAGQVRAVRRRYVDDPEWGRIEDCFERALSLCNKFPVIWMLYCRFSMYRCDPIKTRRTFDRALMALPVTQHARIWELYLLFANQVGGISALRIWRRYVKIEREKCIEKYIDMLLETHPPKYAEAAKCLSSVVDMPKFQSVRGKTRFQLWSELCDLICDHAEEIVGVPTEDAVYFSATAAGNMAGDDRIGAVEPLDVNRILRSGIAKFTDQVGKLWTALAKWWILKGEFDKARDVYEEAIAKVLTVRDFSLVFDAYAEFEESVLKAEMEKLTASQSGDAQESDPIDELDVDIKLARLEALMERRPFLVNDVLLRQNPHNVNEWENRARLYLERKDYEKVVETYTKAVSTISPKKAHGKLHMLWVHFAQFYETGGLLDDFQDEEQVDESELLPVDIDSARQVFERAIKVHFKTVDELAEVWCQWAEMELRMEEYERAIQVMGRATAPPKGLRSNLHQSVRYNDETLPPQQRLFKSLKLWSFYVDLEESIGTVDSTKAAYDRILELKIANAQVICNYAAFLEEQKWFEESYKTYERGIELFGYPMAFDLWTLYLTKFVRRYGGSKLERARDLFENAVDKIPPKYAKSIYLMYAKLEEEYGLARHAMRIYDRATRAVSKEDRFEMYMIYISKASSFFGLPATREIYERAVESLPDKQARTMCIKFAELEIKLGEVDRARAVYGYASQFSDPRMDAEFWKIWHEFEVKYGNEDTFKEMLRIKRSVQAKFNSDLNHISVQLVASKQKDLAAAEAVVPDAMDMLEKAQGGTRVDGFVRAKKTEPKINAPTTKSDTQEENPDEIAMSEGSDDESAEKGKPAGVEKKAVPDAVFGGLADKAKEEKIGAKERFQKVNM